MGKSDPKNNYGHVTRLNRQNIDLLNQVNKLSLENKELYAQLKSSETRKNELDEKLLDQGMRLLEEQKHKNFAEAEAESWKKLTNHIAHTLQTDLAKSKRNLENGLKGFEGSQKGELHKALVHLKRVIEISELIYNYNKLDELVERFEIKPDNDLRKIIENRIADVRDTLETLRISDDKINLLGGLSIPIECDADAYPFSINEKLNEVPGIIFNDLLRNAFKYSNDKNPNIKISITTKESYYSVIISNNTTPRPESTSLKSGLEIVKQFANAIGIYFTEINTDNLDLKTYQLTIPKDIRYGKNKNSSPR